MLRESPFFCIAYMGSCAETSSSEVTTLYNYQNIRNAWCISGVVSASRTIGIIAILGTMSLYEVRCCLQYKTMRYRTDHLVNRQ